jgi:hypothetical protein
MATTDKVGLKIIEIDLVAIKYHPDLESYRGKVKATEWKYHLNMDLYKKEDFETKRKYDIIKVEVEFELYIPGFNEALVTVDLITTYETKRLTKDDVDDMLYIYLYETCIEHASAWLALQSVGTAIDHIVIAHIDHAEYKKNVVKGMNDIWK